MKKEDYRKILNFVLFQIIFAVITFPILVFYGPFEQLKNSLVGMSIHSYRTQYVAKFFLSDRKINEIMSLSKADEVNAVDFIDGLSEVKINKINSNGLRVINIEGSTLKGKLVIVDDPRRVKVGYSSKMPKAGETTSTIARKNNAVAAINAGGFLGDNFGGAGGKPQGFVIHEGKVISDVENHSKKYGVVAFTKSGHLIVGEYSMNQLDNFNIQEAVCFAPAMIVNGKPLIRGDGGWGIAPRTAIAQKKDGSVILLTIDGRSVTSFGASLRDVQEIFLKHDAYTAVNLDGGSSTTLYYKGKIINNPSNALGERTVPTIFYVTESIR